MAQTSPVRERGQTNNTAKTPTTAKSTPAATNMEKTSTPTSTPRKSFLSSLLSPAPQTGSGQKRPGLSSLLRFTLVLVIFMFVIQGLQVGLLLAEQRWHIGLLNHVTSDHNTPFLGGLRWFDLIFFLVVIGFYVALIRFNILPRDIFGARARTTTAQQASTSIERPAGSGKDRSRAARRRAAALAEAEAAAKAAKNVKVSKKAAPTPQPMKVPATVSDSQASGEHDAEYYRVKAAQRLQRRRTGKR